MIKYSLTLCFALAMITSKAAGQDPTYNTIELKSAKRISQDQWKSMVDQSAAQSSGYSSAASSETADLAQKGVRVLKVNDSVQLQSEVTAVFEGVTSAGQSANGTMERRARHQFKLGPGNYTIADGVIKRVQ